MKNWIPAFAGMTKNRPAATFCECLSIKVLGGLVLVSWQFQALSPNGAMGNKYSSKIGGDAWQGIMDNGENAMINQNNSCEKHSSIFPDIALYDIDVDFELNDGKGAWVVILRKNGAPLQALPDVDDYE